MHLHTPLVGFKAFSATFKVMFIEEFRENLDFAKKVTGLEEDEKISKSLAKQALVISVDNELKDLSHVIEKNCSVKIFTS